MDPQRRPAGSPVFNAECAVAAHSRPTFNRMIARAPRALKVAVYIVGAAASLWLGRAVGGALATRLSAYPSAFFLLAFVSAALTAILGAHLENKYVWAGWFKSSENELRWIGRSHSSLLTSEAPAPVAFGLAFGLLSVLMS